MSIFLAYFLDIFLGDLRILRTPTNFLGTLTSKIIFILKKIKNPQLISVFTILIMNIITFFVSLLFLLILRRINSTFEFFGETYLIFSAFSIRLPEKSANEVYDKLYENNIEEARHKLSSITEDKIDNIDENEIIKTTIKGTSQNCLHDFFSPVFYAFIGGGILALLCRLSYIIYHTIIMSSEFDNKEKEKIKALPYFIMDLYNFLPSRLLYFFLPIAAGYKKIKQVIINIWEKRQESTHYLNDFIPINAFFGFINLSLKTNNNVINDSLKEPEIDDIHTAINYMYRLSYIVISFFVAIKFFVN